MRSRHARAYRGGGDIRELLALSQAATAATNDSDRGADQAGFPAGRALRDCRRRHEAVRGTTRAGLDQGHDRGWVPLLHACWSRANAALLLSSKFENAGAGTGRGRVDRPRCDGPRCGRWGHRRSGVPRAVGRSATGGDDVDDDGFAESSAVDLPAVAARRRDPGAAGNGAVAALGVDRWPGSHNQRP
jgi:hypothetical protein